MAITTYPLNGIDYDARDAAGYTATRTSGVYSSEEDFAVTAAGGLSVTVSAGVGWVHPAQFEGYSVILREAETLTLALADGQRPRIDRIVLRYDAAARKSSLLVLQGTPDTQPTAPDISRTALLYDLCLAQITRPAGSTTIVAGNITDTRLDPALCGVMRDGVTGIPTEELLASAREHINALEETASAAAKEANASKTAAARSEANSKAYKEAAETSEHNAGVYADAAEGAADAAARSASAAADSATKASGSASAAEESKTAAATSEANAAKHEEAAKKAADEAGAKAGTDKTLSIENAPADAAVVGGYILDRTKDTPELVFYSKTETDAKIKELLARQREEDYAKIKFWISEDSTSPAELFGGTWEEIASERALMGRSSSHAAGSIVDAGLPNITGSAYGDVQQSGASVYWAGSGAIQTSQDSGGSGIVMYKAADYGNHRSILKFNASKSNSIYGRSGTVQPAAYYVYIWRRIA